MGLGYGLVMAGAQLGLQSVLIKPKRSIGAFTAQVTISERHTDELEIVNHPVEMGAQISDHVFKRPPEVVIECAWSDSPSVSGLVGGIIAAVEGTVAGVQSILTGNSPDQVRDIYDRLVKLQESFELITVYTGKRVYFNMLIRSMMVETDKDTEHVLRVTATLRQVLRVSVRTVSISAAQADQTDPQSTLPPVDKGRKQLDPVAQSFSVRDGMLSVQEHSIPPPLP